MSVCQVDGCESEVRARGLCGKHYQRLRVHGDPIKLPTRIRPTRPFEERFWEKVNKTETCWLWTAKVDRWGYGRFARGPKKAGFAQAHRVAYELVIGPIPDGLTIDHLCRVTGCVNPEHLEPVTLAENVRRMNAAIRRSHKTHCVNGHQFTPDNTKTRANGRRKCRACDRDYAARAYLRKKGIAA